MLMGESAKIATAIPRMLTIQYNQCYKYPASIPIRYHQIQILSNPSMDCTSSITKFSLSSKIYYPTFSHDTTTTKPLCTVVMAMQQLKLKKLSQRRRRLVVVASTSIPSRTFVVPKVIYDVFVSFHGPDTRNNFTSHLRYGLENANINTFIDSKIPRGDNIASSLFQAIENSRIAIIVFSRNFASSTWCLNEVAKILECKNSRGQLVLPVFFHVNPSDIRKQTGDVQLDFAKLEEKYRDDFQKVEKWRSALREVVDMFGWHITSTVVEAEIVQQIVGVVSSRLFEEYTVEHSRRADDLL